MDAIKKALDDTYPTIAFDDLRGGDRVIAWDEDRVAEGTLEGKEPQYSIYGGRAWDTTDCEQIWDDSATIYLVDRPERELPKDGILLRIKWCGKWYEGPFILHSQKFDPDGNLWVSWNMDVTQDEIEDFELGKVVPA